MSRADDTIRADYTYAAAFPSGARVKRRRFTSAELDRVVARAIATSELEDTIQQAVFGRAQPPEDTLAVDPYSD